VYVTFANERALRLFRPRWSGFVAQGARLTWCRLIGRCPARTPAPPASSLPPAATPPPLEELRPTRSFPARNDQRSRGFVSRWANRRTNNQHFGGGRPHEESNSKQERMRHCRNEALNIFMFPFTVVFLHWYLKIEAQKCFVTLRITSDVYTRLRHTICSTHHRHRRRKVTYQQLQGCTLDAPSPAN